MKFMVVPFFLFLVAGYCYVAWHTWHILPLSVLLRTIIVSLMTLAFLCLFVSIMVKLDSLPMSLARAIDIVGTSSLFVYLYAAIVFIVLDVARLVGIVPRWFLHDSIAGSLSIVVLLIAVFIYGNVHYHNKTCRRLELTATSPLKQPKSIVMISDLHLGYYNTRKELARWVDIINAEAPDLILIAGDVVDISVRPLLQEGMAEEFLRLNAPVYACLGNHDYYADAGKTAAFLRSAGITMLRDSSVVIDDEIAIIGRDDRTNRNRESLLKLVEKTPTSKYTILLDHQPYNLEEAEKASIDFQFSGHTHHGQVWPISWIVQAIYEDGYGDLIKGTTRYYVTSGIGIWGGKFRIGTGSEHVSVTIH